VNQFEGFQKTPIKKNERNDGKCQFCFSTAQSPFGCRFCGSTQFKYDEEPVSALSQFGVNNYKEWSELSLKEKVEIRAAITEHDSELKRRNRKNWWKP
jgi:predicted  nucleic acid-binding Zn-ribbon protein